MDNIIRLLCDHCGNPYTGKVNDVCPGCRKGKGVRRPSVKAMKAQGHTKATGYLVGAKAVNYYGSYHNSDYSGGKIARRAMDN
jgi:hypothetical protein